MKSGLKMDKTNRKLSIEVSELLSKEHYTVTLSSNKTYTCNCGKYSNDTQCEHISFIQNRWGHLKLEDSILSSTKSRLSPKQMKSNIESFDTDNQDIC